jgi:hypothetical protein
MKYYEALRVWNDRMGHEGYCRPRKGTPEHQQVLDIQKGTDKKKAGGVIAGAIKRKMTAQFEPKPPPPKPAGKDPFGGISQFNKDRIDKGKTRKQGLVFKPRVKEPVKVDDTKDKAASILAAAVKRKMTKQFEPEPKPPPPKPKRKYTKKVKQPVKVDDTKDKTPASTVKIPYDLFLNELDEYISENTKDTKKNFEIFKLILKKVIENVNTNNKTISIYGANFETKRYGLSNESIKEIYDLYITKSDKPFYINLKKQMVKNIEDIAYEVFVYLRYLKDDRPKAPAIKAKGILAAAVKRKMTKQFELSPLKPPVYDPDMFNDLSIDIANDFLKIMKSPDAFNSLTASIDFDEVDYLNEMLNDYNIDYRVKYGKLISKKLSVIKDGDCLVKTNKAGFKFQLSNILYLGNTIGEPSADGIIFLSSVEGVKEPFPIATKLQIGTKKDIKKVFDKECHTNEMIRDNFIFTKKSPFFLIQYASSLCIDKKETTAICVNELAHGDLKKLIISTPQLFVDDIYTIFLECVMAIYSYHKITGMAHTDCHWGNFLYHENFSRYNTYSKYKLDSSIGDIYVKNPLVNMYIWDFGRAVPLTDWKDPNKYNDYFKLILNFQLALYNQVINWDTITDGIDRNNAIKRFEKFYNEINNFVDDYNKSGGNALGETELVSSIIRFVIKNDLNKSVVKERPKNVIAEYSLVIR